jgi:hypothetical protein
VCRIGGQTVAATVWDTPAGRALLDRLPLNLSFSNLNGNEEIGHSPGPRPMEGGTGGR